MYKKRMAEIAERKAEILKEIDQADETRTAQLEKETDELNQEISTLRSKQAVADKLGEALPATSELEQRGRTPSDLETRAKQLRESRSVTINGGTLVQAKKTAGIYGGPVEVSSIVDQVSAVPCQGMGEYEVAYVISSGDGTDTDEGAEVKEEDPTFGSASIIPGSITTYTEISREVLKLSDMEYLSRVEQAAKTALRKKVAAKIVNTEADAKFTSLFKAEACVTDLELSEINAQTLRKIAMSYGGDEAVSGNAVLYLNKVDLIAFGDVRGTSEKKAVYEITPDSDNPNTGIIKDGGLSVRYCLNSKLKSLHHASAGTYCMAYGNPRNFELGVFSDYTVIVDESAALKRRMVAVLGEVMMGGNVVVYDGFVRVKKASASA